MSCALMHIMSETQQYCSSDYETIGVAGRPLNKRQPWRRRRLRVYWKTRLLYYLQRSLINSALRV